MNAKVSELDEYEFMVLLYKQIKNYTHTHTLSNCHSTGLIAVTPLHC